MYVDRIEINYKIAISCIFFIFTVFISLHSVLYANLFSPLIFSLFFLTMGILIITLVMKDNYLNSMFIFSLFLFIYGFNSTLQYYYQLSMYDTWNIYSDETLFFSYTNDMSSLIIVDNIIDLLSDIKYSAMFGYIYPAGFIALISNYIDQNSILVQKIFIMYISAFNSVILYNIIQKYFSKTNALYLTILFSLFSFTLFFSSIIMRDQLVSFSYLLFFYIFLNKISMKNLLFLIFVIFFSILVRPETGMFLFLFLVLYIYNLFVLIKRKQLKIIFSLIAIIVFLLCIMFYGDKIILSYTLTVIGSNELANSQASNSSFGIILYNLPYGLNYIFLSLFSQIQPFPFWSVFSRDLMNPIAGMQYVFAGLFWYFVVGILIINIIKFKLLKNIDRRLLLLFIGSCIYIVLISAIAPDERRLMAVYPVLYIVSAIGFLYCMKNKIKYIIYTIFFYLLLVCLYLILKFGM